MTAEALSPPNPTESLREQLIREGKVVPALDSAASPSIDLTAHDRIFEHIKKLTELFSKNYLEKYREKFIRDNYIKALKYFGESFFTDDFKLSSRGKKVAINYYFALFIKHLKIIYSALNSFGKFLSNRVSIIRSGFFFAFKENMKNTP